MDLSLETVGTIVAILVGVGTVGAAIYRYWGLPDRMDMAEKGLATLSKTSSECEDTTDTKIKDAVTASRTELIQIQSAMVKKLEDCSALHQASKADLYNKLNTLYDQVAANKLEAATAMTAIREIQNGVKERFQALGRIEDLVGTVLQANAEKKAEIARLMDDYQQLSELVQRLNREIGELRARIEIRDKP